MTVVAPHLTHGGGVGWNGSGITHGSLIFRRERDWSLSHRRLAQGPLPMMLGIVRLGHEEVE